MRLAAYEPQSEWFQVPHRKNGMLQYFSQDLGRQFKEFHLSVQWTKRTYQDFNACWEGGK